MNRISRRRFIAAGAATAAAAQLQGRKLTRRLHAGDIRDRGATRLHHDHASWRSLTTRPQATADIDLYQAGPGVPTLTC